MVPNSSIHNVTEWNISDIMWRFSKVIIPVLVDLLMPGCRGNSKQIHIADIKKSAVMEEVLGHRSMSQKMYSKYKKINVIIMLYILYIMLYITNTF